MESILVVDDQKNVRTAMRIGLGRMGYQVDVASNAKSALLKLKEKSFDVVLADVRMPDTNGFILANIIRKLYPGVRIILMSAYDFAEYERYDSPISYPKLGKPFGMSELLSIIKNTDIGFQHSEMQN